MSRIIAHRGSAHQGEMKTAQENSMQAFRAAADKGAKWLETDVRIIADGSLILFHDDDLTRICKRKEKTSALTAALAKELGIVFLSDLIQASLGIGLNLELKLDKGADEKTMVRLATAVAEKIKEHAPLPPIFISSFYGLALEAFRERAPSIPVGFSCFEVDDKVLGFAKNLGAVSVHSSIKHTSPSHIKKVLAAGLESYVYTINDSATAEPLWQAGMTGLFTYEIEKFTTYL